jgi:hypothetical protein
MRMIWIREGNLFLENMGKYRKGTAVVEAEQFLINVRPLPFEPDPVVCLGNDGWYVITINGQEVPIADGEWIIRETGTKDRAYTCKPDVFEKTYESLVRERG